MRSIATRLILCTSLFAILSLPATASALNILLTNDDGYDAPGITILRGALLAAGHQVTVVAPAENQSGKGGSINTEALNFTPGEGLMQLVNHGGGVFSLAGTPADSVKAGLDIVMKNNPPDLIVSGCNFGQNLGKPGTNTSGTEGAALRAAFSGFPGIACSVGLLFSEAQGNFPSTVAAFGPASDFMVRAIDALVEKNGIQVLPNRTAALNINFPVPYGDIVGVETTVLADGSDLELPLFDPSQGFPQLGIPPLPFPSCDDAISMGGACFAAVGVGFSPDEGPKTDLGAHRDNYISITPYSADMTGPDNGISGALKQLDP
jgi:5'/3'-nucleotidase SurE